MEYKYNSQFKHQILLWQMMYEIDEDGDPLLDFLEDWGEERIIENTLDEEKLYNDAGFQIEDNYIF